MGRPRKEEAEAHTVHGIPDTALCRHRHRRSRRRGALADQERLVRASATTQEFLDRHRGGDYYDTGVVCGSDLGGANDMSNTSGDGGEIERHSRMETRWTSGGARKWGTRNHINDIDWEYVYNKIDNIDTSIDILRQLAAVYTATQRCFKSRRRSCVYRGGDGKLVLALMNDRHKLKQVASLSGNGHSPSDSQR